jgi:ATP-dependent helicase/nuclease subunit A
VAIPIAMFIGTHPLVGQNSVPIDQAERERLLAELDATFFVEAGAGTGKTTALVRRVVELAKAGRMSMLGLAAITFTEAAAAELRDRVRQGLESAAADDELAAESRSRCEVAAREVDLAAIQTVHAFAGALLRTFPIEAGLPPGFGTLDQIQRDLAFDERFRAWLYDEVPEEGNPAREAVRRIFALGMTPDRLRELARGLQDQYDLLEAEPLATGARPALGWDSPEPADAIQVAQRWGAELEGLLPMLEHARDPAAGRLAREVRNVQFVAGRMRQAADDDEALEALQGFLQRYPRRSGAQSEWHQGYEQDVRDIKAAFKDSRAEVEDALAEHRAAALGALLGHLRDLTLRYAAERKRQGMATFHDLLTWTRDLLRDHPDVRRRAQARWQRLFVDEFQDTDPLQAEIAVLLASEPNQAEERDWRELRLVPGMLFLVGDPKQSIYRFRRADIAMYDAIYERFADAAERLSLVQNFRSVAPVIRWVNHHFTVDMDGERGVQARYTELHPRPGGETTLADADCGVRLLGGFVDGKAAMRAREEADAIARLVRRMVAEGWPVLDPESGQPRPVRYQDVCLLMPTRTNLRWLERKLEAYDLPYRMQSGTLVLNTQEVRELLACLRAIDDPSDQVALVAALRSPAYGCSDAELLQWAEADGALSYLREEGGCDGPVREAFVSLRGFHMRRLDHSAAITAERFIRQRMLAEQAFGHPRPREAWRRLRYVVAQARALAGSGQPTLRALLDWLEGLQRTSFYDAESPTPEADEDAVQLMTIHGAKGLEFPVVILTGLGSRPRDQSTIAFVPDRIGGQLHVRCGEFQTPGYAREHEQQLDAAERVRLLYVAATRAREHLVLSLFRGKDPCHAQRIADILAGDGIALCQEIPLPIELELTQPIPVEQSSTSASRTPGMNAQRDAAPVRAEPVDAPTEQSIAETAEAHREAENAWMEQRARRLAGYASQRHVTPTGLAKRQAGGIAPLEFEDEELAPPTREETVSSVLFRGGRAQTGVGRAVHAVLQTINLSTLDGLELLSQAAAEQYGVPDRAERIARLTRQLQQSATLQRVLTEGRYWREVPVATQLNGEILEGIIDLLHESSTGELTIVDYKTDSVPDDADRQQLLDYYRVQMAAYALALRSSTKREVANTVILFAGRDAMFEEVL